MDQEDENLKKLRKTVKELRGNENITFAEMSKTTTKKNKKYCIII